MRKSRRLLERVVDCISRRRGKVRVEYVSEARLDVVWPHAVGFDRASQLQCSARKLYPNFKATLTKKSAKAKKDTKKAKEDSEEDSAEDDGDSGSKSEAKEDWEEDDGDSGSGSGAGIIG